MTDVATNSVTISDWVGFALTLFVFFCSQAVALFIWYRRHKADQKAERTRLEDKQEHARKQQLKELQTIVDKDIGAVREEVADIRSDIEKQEEIQRQRNEHLHGHMRRIEESRPTREEMERNLGQLKELVVTTKTDLEKAVAYGFNNLDRRFDEFKEYAKDLMSSSRR